MSRTHSLLSTVTATRQAQATIINMSNRSPCFGSWPLTSILHTVTSIYRHQSDPPPLCSRPAKVLTGAYKAFRGLAPLHTPSKVVTFLLKQCTQFLLPSEPLPRPGVLFLQILLWLALPHHSGRRLKSTHLREILWLHRIKNCLLPAFIRQITFFYCLQIMRHKLRVYSLYLFSYTCVVAMPPPLECQQEIWLSCSLL